MSNHAFHFIRRDLISSLRLCLEASLRHNHVVDLELSSCSLYNLFFNGVFSDEAVDYNILFLTDSVSPVNGLEVHLGIPIRVVDEDDISCVKINT